MTREFVAAKYPIGTRIKLYLTKCKTVLTTVLQQSDKALWVKRDDGFTDVILLGKDRFSVVYN